MRACARARVRAHTHAHAHACTFAHTHTHTHISSNRAVTARLTDASQPIHPQHKHTLTHTHVHARRNAHTHANTHSHTHTHAHIYIHPPPRSHAHTITSSNMAATARFSEACKWLAACSPRIRDTLCRFSVRTHKCQHASVRKKRARSRGQVDEH